MAQYFPQNSFLKQINLPIIIRSSNKEHSYNIHVYCRKITIWILAMYILPMYKCFKTSFAVMVINKLHGRSCDLFL